jgi:S-adenosylmethionine:tRNA ribosyltransferase-isomerase
MKNPELDLSFYDYKFPPNLVAQKPAEKRDEARLLVLARQDKSVQHKKFFEITGFLEPGDCLVLNKTRVTPSRIFGKKVTGGKVEVLALSAMGDDKNSTLAEALTRPKLKIGEQIIFPDSSVAVVRDIRASGTTILEISGSTLINLINTFGKMPLPPYIKRLPADAADKADRERYQTVYAREEGSIAAPTAGLHFTGELLSKLRSSGVRIAELTLHVGWGTFKPIKTQNIVEHKMLPEYFSISEEAAAAINESKAAKKRVIAVGTTTTRALEAGFSGYPVKPSSGEAAIFIYPGYEFKVIDGLVTNFHLPCSTPLMLASAFASKELLFKAYDEAVRNEYRLFSYGDAMLII